MRLIGKCTTAGAWEFLLRLGFAGVETLADTQRHGAR